jgi:hypothetical protein
MLKQTLTLIFTIILTAVLLIGCEQSEPLSSLSSEELIEQKTAENHTENHKSDKGVFRQTTDVFGQGPNGSVVAENGAVIRRTSNGISIKLTMPAPEPGTYDYPTEGEAFSGPGHPEVFSLWGFVFKDPEAEDWDGAFAVTGHVVGESTLTLSGNITLMSEPFLGTKLENPRGAKVRLAVAPHGALNPDLLPEALGTPTGPGPDIWWMAEFESPDY